MIVKIIDYSLENAKPQDKVSLNTGKNCVATNNYDAYAYKYPESFADDGTIPAHNNANNR